jgi:hypothetical protein
MNMSIASISKSDSLVGRRSFSLPSEAWKSIARKSEFTSNFSRKNETEKPAYTLPMLDFLAPFSSLGTLLGGLRAAI